MKLFIYCPFITLGRGGLERVGTELVNALSRRGHEILLGYNDKKSNEFAFPLEKNIRLLPWKGSSYLGLRDVIEEEDPDLYFVFNGGYRLMEFQAAAEDTGVPFAYQESTNPQRLRRDNWALLRNIPLGQAAWERELVASAAVRIRQTMPSYAQTLPPYIRNQVRFFPNAVTPASQRADLVGPAGKTIINIGGLKKVKRLFPLLEAFKLLAEDFPDWTVKSFGNGFHYESDHQEAIHAYVKEAGLEGRVLFPGETDSIYDEYAKAQIHVITSINEGRPTCVCESMAHGLPSVGFQDCPGTNEIIRHGHNGLLLDYDALGPRGFADELGTLMSSAEERIRLGENAYQESLEFLPQKIYGQWEEFFKEAAAYKSEPDRLLREQMAIDPETARHAARMRPAHIWEQTAKAQA